ncbi:MAG TPA: glycoside hydrolase family 3 C-terminal domain-containing protein [Pyrinomonadaceae bacterium]|jgi:beta-glucosidase
MNFVLKFRLPWLAVFLLLNALFPALANAQNNLSKNQETEKRIEKLLEELSLDEKISLISGTGFDTVAIPRLGIPSLKMTDGPVGVRQAPATSFPSSIALAASFDTGLIRRVAQAIAEETKAKGKNVLLGPCVNIQRTPFGGRNFESFGEDPYLAAQMAVAYIKGIQSENVIPSVKHFAANNQEINRMTIDARVDERALNEIYFPAFRAAVQEANVWTVMAAYNKLNGFYASENNYLLNEILKKRWNFQGLVMSDWGAVHSTLPTLKNGLDLEMPTGEFLNAPAVKKALAGGEVSETNINEMVRRSLRVMFWAGLMDGKSADNGSIDTPEHRALALEAARGGIVLLQNQREVLPVDLTKTRSIAVIGPNADAARIGGGGSAQVVPFYSVSPLEGIRKAVGTSAQINFSSGIVALEDTTPIPTANLTVPDGKSNGLEGEYFANMTFDGAPAFTRVDALLDFHWGTGSPAENYPSDLFSNRWTGNLTASVTGRYAISLSSNDGGRLYLDDKLIVDVWGDHASLKGAATVELKQGEPHKIRVEHYENRGNADLVLGWRLLEEDILQKAVDAAAKSDVAIIFAGLSDAFEVEARDRADLNLPKEQEELIERVARVNPNTVVVMTSGAPVLMNKWIGKVSAVVQAFYYGQEGGSAIADVLFGKFAPSGKLPATFLRRWEDSSAFGRYPGDGKTVDYSEGILVGYRWFDTKNIEPLFPFGHGLSYTNFKYSGLKLINGKKAGATIQFEIENTGKMDGAEVAQVYVADVFASVPRPAKELKGFQKVFLKAGEKKPVTVALNQNAFAFYAPDSQNWIAEKGDFKILVGSSSRDIRLRGDYKLNETIVQK